MCQCPIFINADSLQNGTALVCQTLTLVLYVILHDNHYERIKLDTIKIYII